LDFKIKNFWHHRVEMDFHWSNVSIAFGFVVYRLHQCFEKTRPIVCIEKCKIICWWM